MSVPYECTNLLIAASDNLSSKREVQQKSGVLGVV